MENNIIYNNLTLNELNNEYNNLTYYSIKRGNNLTTKEYENQFRLTIYIHYF